MASTNIATLNTMVTANAVQFNAELGRAGQSGKKFSKNTKDAFGEIKNALTFGAVLAYAHSVIDLGSQINDLSLQAGMTTQAFQTLSNVGMDSGFTMEQVAKSAEDLRNHIQDAADGSKPMVDGLHKLNLTAAGLQALKPEEQWEVIAKRIANATDKQEAMNIASELFGTKNAPKMREILEKLATEGYDKLAASTQELSFSPEQLKSLDDAGDKLAYIAKLAKVISAVGFLKAFDAGSGFFDDMFKDMAKQSDANEKAFTDSNWGPKMNMDALAAKDHMRAIEDPNHGRGLVGDPSKGTEGNPVAVKLSADVEARMKAGEAEALKHKDPFVNLQANKTQEEEIGKLLDLFFDPIDEKSKRNPVVRPGEYQSPQADSLARIGLLTGAQVNPEQKRQSKTLLSIHEVLQSINRGIRGQEGSTFAN